MRLTVVLYMNIVLPPCTGPLYLPRYGTGEVTSRRRNYRTLRIVVPASTTSAITSECRNSGFVVSWAAQIHKPPLARALIQELMHSRSQSKSAHHAHRGDVET